MSFQSRIHEHLLFYFNLLPMLIILVLIVFLQTEDFLTFLLILLVDFVPAHLFFDLRLLFAPWVASSALYSCNIVVWNTCWWWNFRTTNEFARFILSETGLTRLWIAKRCVLKFISVLTRKRRFWNFQIVLQQWGTSRSVYFLFCDSQRVRKRAVVFVHLAINLFALFFVFLHL